MPELDINSVYTEEPSGTPIVFPSPAHMLAVIKPELELYNWQTEELLRLAGFLDPHDLTKQSKITPENPYMLAMPAANGSGKDLVIIAAFCVWHALKGVHNFCFVTSSSYEQIKTQTNPHIKDLCACANKKFGPTFRSVENYHVCTKTASEIKLYVTDEAGRAEGFHPRFGGEMAMIFNEAKTISEELWSAFRRCTGYAYWLEISSPGIKSGHFYESYKESVAYPAQPELGKYFSRRITAYDCPHIPTSHIERTKRVESKEWFESSIEALFSDFGASNIVKEAVWDQAANINPAYITHNGYAIGGDLAAGGDECSFYLRHGPKIIDETHFRQRDTTITAEIFDIKFGYVKDKEDLIIRLDDGGVGHGIIDNLVKMGWKIERIHNQSAAVNKREFLNRGAEMYVHLARLLQHKLIPSYGKRDAKLRTQITSRIADNLDGGKFRLEKKELHRERTKSSPDRADAYVLAYSSYPLEIRTSYQPETKPAFQSFADFEEAYTWGSLTPKSNANTGKRTFLRYV